VLYLTMPVAIGNLWIYFANLTEIEPANFPDCVPRNQISIELQFTWLRE